MATEQVLSTYRSRQTENPLTALAQLANTIDVLDQFLKHSSDLSANRQITYVRNTLCVSLELWQNDIARRLNQSEGNFYIFSMTAQEGTAFLRRMVPSFSFAAEELRRLAKEIPSLTSQAHLADLVEKLAEGAKVYGENNKSCLTIALESGVQWTRLDIAPIPLPKDRV